MALRFYMDVHVPAAITDGLRRRGINVLTSQEDGTRNASDEDLLNRATALGHLMFSQDEDLLGIASDWQRMGHHFSGLLFAPQQGVGIGRCVDDLELIARCCSLDELANRLFFIPLH